MYGTDWIIVMQSVYTGQQFNSWASLLDVWYKGAYARCWVFTKAIVGLKTRLSL
jgi:hypothetical protein